MIFARENAYSTYLSHLEYLIRNRKIVAKEALNLSRTSLIFTDPDLRWLIRGVNSTIHAAELDFFFQVSPLILDLPRVRDGQDKGLWDSDSEVGLRFRLHDLQLKAIIQPFVGRSVDFDSIFRLITEVIPEGSILGNEFFSLFGRPRFRGQEEYEKFVKRLVASEQKTSQILGRFAQFKLKLFSVEGLPHQRGKIDSLAAQDLLRDAQTLIAEYDGLPYSTDRIELSKRQYEPIRKDLYSLSERLSGLVADSTETTAPKRAIPGVVSIDYSGTAGVVRERPVKIDLKRFQKESDELVDLSQQGKAHKGDRITWATRFDTFSNRHTPSASLNLVACGTVDVWWNKGAVLVMREKGLLEEAILDPDAFYSDVCWDGENLWVASQLKGVAILDLTTLDWNHVCNDEHGLPPANRRMQIIPMKPGKIFAVGSFGKNCRAWCAVIAKEGKKLTHDVFHDATHAMQNGESFDWSDPEASFFPAWIARYQQNSNGQPMFLVSRAHPVFEGSRNLFFTDEHLPLLVDPSQRKVEVFDCPMEISVAPHGMDNRDTFFSKDDELFRCRRYSIRHIIPKQKDDDRWGSLGDARKGIKFEKFKHADIPELHRFIKQEQKLILPGVQWIRLDPETMKVERFSSADSNALLKVRDFYGYSAHYGLMGWNMNWHAEGFDFTQFQLELHPK